MLILAVHLIKSVLALQKEIVLMPWALNLMGNHLKSVLI